VAHVATLAGMSTAKRAALLTLGGSVERA